MMNDIEKLQKRFLEIQESYENGDEDAQLIYDLEEDMREAQDLAFTDKELQEVDELNEKIKEFKKEYDFYDPEAELDTMFPNRYDEGFDEDDMSWESVFGD